MISRVLVDTGPLVALRLEDETHHEKCVQALRDLRPPLLTCWPVLTEAAYLLQSHPQQVCELLASTAGGFLEILPLTSADVPGINAILHRYADQDFQLADAALMHLAEREQIENVFTLDLRDFGVYRTPAGKSLTIIGG